LRNISFTGVSRSNNGIIVCPKSDGGVAAGRGLVGRFVALDAEDGGRFEGSGENVVGSLNAGGFFPTSELDLETRFIAFDEEDGGGFEGSENVVGLEGNTLRAKTVP